MSMIDISTNSPSTSVRAFEKFWQVRRVVNLLATRELKPFRIGLKQALLIFYLNREGHSTQAQLARFTGTDPAAMARAVRSLSVYGWISQKEDPRDRRQSRLVLTRPGKTLAKKIEKLFQQLENRFGASLNRQESETLDHLLDKILKGFATS